MTEWILHDGKTFPKIHGKVVHIRYHNGDNSTAVNDTWDEDEWVWELDALGKPVSTIDKYADTVLSYKIEKNAAFHMLREIAENV